MKIDASTIIGLLAIGLLFYMIFRHGGCCGGHVQHYRRKPQESYKQDKNAHDKSYDNPGKRCH